MAYPSVACWEIRIQVTAPMPDPVIDAGGIPASVSIAADVAAINPEGGEVSVAMDSGSEVVSELNVINPAGGTISASLVAGSAISADLEA